MSEKNNRPVLLILTSNWISLVGVTLVTVAAVSWLVVMASGGKTDNPYIGLLTAMALPTVFFAGLALIPLGVAMGRKSVDAQFATEGSRRAAWRRAGVFFVLMTFVNVVIASQLTYRAVGHMETNQFCGQSCHVMRPEFMAHLSPPHQNVACAECHVTPGAAGWLHAKMGGMKQMQSVIFSTYPRPLESGLESNRLVSSKGTCEGCHSVQAPRGSRLRVLTKFGEDEGNSRTSTVLMMAVGGATSGGIHGAHMGPNVTIRYAALDKKRGAIPWVEYRNASSGETRSFYATGKTAASVKDLPIHEMECADCHNRAAHSFEKPDRAIDQSLAEGRIAVGLPFVKKTGLGLLNAVYPEGEAARKISAGLMAFYRQKYPDLAASHEKEIAAAGAELVTIYQRNVFPDMKVTWGTYSNNLGHTDSPGCFRCHDDDHAQSNKKTISQDCGVCHQVLATDEASPEVLKTLGIGK